MRFVILLLGVSLCSGCAGGRSQFGSDTSVKVVREEGLPPPTGIDMSSFNRPYLIGPFDKLTIDVFGIEELSKKEVQVDASGRLSFPLVGTVEVAGKTPGEVEQLLKRRLALAYVRNPQVTVNLKETVSQVVTVEGEVKEPGLYPVVGRMTLLRTIATAKGMTEFSKLDDVVVFRNVGDQRMAGLYNVRAIRRGAYPDPEVYANDVVVVGDSTARRRFKDFLGIVPLLTAPLIVSLQR